MQRRPMPHVIVLLPGIMGSARKKDGKDVWALSGSALFRALLSLGKDVRSLKLVGDDPKARNAQSN